MEEARMAIDFGADALGLVGQMPSGPEVISDELIREIAAGIPPPTSTFLLTSYTSSAEIIRHHEITRTSTIQIVDALTRGSYSDLRLAMPAIKLVQVIHVIDGSSSEEAINEVDPWGIDLCSGVRTKGELDPGKLENFFSAIF
jgi:phosphoribosylanthranilate isomerase